MDVGAFFRGRLGLDRTAAVVWLIVAAFLIAKSQVWAGLHDLDTDDVMRLVQVRDWMAGQDWFDTTQHRGWPAPGFSIHWSRIPDLAVAGLIGLFGLALPKGPAELAAMTAWPLLQLAVVLPLVGLAAKRLAGAAAMAPAMLMFGLLGPAMWQFGPGRIDHHGLQMIGAFAMLAGVLSLRRGAAAGLAAGLGGAFALGIGLETLLFWLTLCAAVGLILVRDGARVRGAVTAFGLATAIATPALAFGTNATRYIASQVCDQAAWPVLALAVVGGLGLALCAQACARISNAWRRLLPVAAAGLAAAAAYGLAGPDCLRGPYADIDPRLGPIWMDHVTEGRSLAWLLAHLDPYGVSAAAILALSLAAAAVLFWRRPALRRMTAILAALLLGAFALLFVQMRVVSYAAAFASPLIAAALVAAARAARTPRRHWGAVMLAGLIVTVGAPMAAKSLAKTAVSAKPAGGGGVAQAKGCYDPQAYERLATLEPGLTAAPIDSGPFILAASPLSVMSAPYHRNATGIIAAHDLMASGPGRGEAMARRLGVRYVVICRSGEVTRYRRIAPDSLAARLDRGEVPAWLSPATGGEGPVHAFVVREAADPSK